ncbi:MAG: DUF4432 family protein [Propioniciclava sp.]
MTRSAPAFDEEATHGLLPATQDLIDVDHLVVDDGPARGSRVLTVRTDGGLMFDVLPDRGMDIGRTWAAGRSIGWRSPVAHAAPGRSDAGQGWLDGWTGGLLTTCGLRNVGSPSEGFGQHGSYTDLASHSIQVHRRLIDGGGAVQVQGVVDDVSSLGPHLRLTRSITTQNHRHRIVIEDQLENLGPETEQTPILYHVNLGYPFLTAASEYQIDGTDASQDWQRMGGAQAGAVDRILTHDLVGETAQASITSPHLGLRATVRWRRDWLPFLHTWRRNIPGQFVASIEPANATLAGRATDREAGIAPLLEPGEARTTGIEIELLALS